MTEQEARNELAAAAVQMRQVQTRLSVLNARWLELVNRRIQAAAIVREFEVARTEGKIE
jgi:hypothetical protein